MPLNVGELFANLSLKTDQFDQSLTLGMQRLTLAANRIGANLSAAGQRSGRMFSLGLASGISAGRSAVTSAAARVAAAAVAAANSRLKIASPSRVMAQSGVYFSEGFARGVRQSARQAAAAAEDMAGMSAAAAKQSAPAAPPDYDRLAALLTLPDVALYMDGKRLAEVNCTQSARAQSARSRRIALGYGVNRR